MKNITSKAVSYTALASLVLKVYEHADFNGEVLTYNRPVAIPDMRNAYNAPLVATLKNFNDKISSFQLIGESVTLPVPSSVKIYMRAIVTFYEDANCAYGSASFLIDRDNPQVSHSNFKKVKRCSSCKYNMNDRTSSLKLYWVD